jgi:hypothetical protein
MLESSSCPSANIAATFGGGEVLHLCERDLNHDVSILISPSEEARGARPRSNVSRRDLARKANEAMFRASPELNAKAFDSL